MMIKLPNSQKGFSLIEIVLVLLIIFFLILLIANIPTSLAAITRSKNTSLAKDIAGKEMDFLRRQAYESLSLTEEPVTFNDVRLQELPQSNAVYEIKSCSSEVCISEEEIKEIRILVTWEESKEAKQVELNTLVGSGGIGQ